MRFVALVSGGKDSCFNVLHCLKQGHELAAFANLYPADETKQELDSYMFQTVGHDIVSHYDRCAGVPLFRQPITHGSSKNLEMNYTLTLEDEIEDLHALLTKVKREVPGVEAVSVGAILSSYQRTRVEDVCRRLNLTVLSYLWQRDQLELMSEMCLMSKNSQDEESECSKIDARIIKVAAVGLDQSHLNMSLPQIFPVMTKLNRMYEVHICGEGGEFETMVLDAPFFVNGSLEVVDQVVDTSDESNGVYSVQLGVNFKPRKKICDIKEALQSLPVPPLLDGKWACLLDELENYNFRFPDLRDSVTKQSTSDTPEVSVVQSRGLLYVSNLRGKPTSASVEEQTREVLDQLSTIMNKMRVVPSQAVSCSLILHSMADFSVVNSIYNGFFDISRHGPLPPSRACVESKELGQECLIQLSIVFDVHDSVSKLANGTTIYRNKNGLHVQGRSYWAPCNIGPYSQAIWLNSDKNKVSWLSGQISLVPSSMEMVTREPLSQGVFSLRHFDTLKTTIETKKQLFMTCFTTSYTMVSMAKRIWSLYCNGMQYRYDEWMDKDEDPEECLIIVKVSELPRSALCEWSGVACQDLSVSDPDEDELTEGVSKSMSQLKIGAGSSCVVNTVEVANGQNQSQFITGFANSIEELSAFMASITLPYKATLYYNPSDLDSFDSLRNTEFIPVESVFDFRGESRRFGFHVVV